MTGLTHPRRLLVLPNGDVIVAEQRAGYLTLLRDRLFASVSPRLKSEIESAIRTIEAQARPPSGSPFPDEQVRSARARVMEVAHGALLFDT